MLPATTIACPYCGETIEILVDVSAGDQRYIEDCQVCCRPIEVRVRVDGADAWQVSVAGEDEA